jgi:hypothetical protein
MGGLAEAIGLSPERRLSGLVRGPRRPSRCEMIPQCLVWAKFHAAGEGVDDLLGSLKG